MWGNVQPTFVDVFDTGAALGNRAFSTAVFAVLFVLIVTVYLIFLVSRHWIIWGGLGGGSLIIFYWYAKLM